MNVFSFMHKCFSRYSVAALCVAASTMYGQYAGPTLTLPARVTNVSVSTDGQTPADLKVEVGDLIGIQVVGAPEIIFGQSHQPSVGGDTEAGQSVDGIKVNQQGNISLPFIGVVKVAGLTALEVADKLRQSWKDTGILTDPQVVVTLVGSPSRNVTVLGEVVRPSELRTITPIKLLDAIAACGGLTNFASHALVIHRRGLPDPIKVELGVDPVKAVLADLPLMPGDKLIIPRIGNVYILGAVKNNLAVPAQSDHALTVLRAVTLAGGVKFSAKRHNAKIIRYSESNQRLEIPVNYNAILAGKQSDIALNSEDILFFPVSAGRAIVSEGGIGVATSVLYGSMYAFATIR